MRNVVCWDFDFTLASAPGLWGGCLRRAIMQVRPDLAPDIELVKRCVLPELPWNHPEADNTAYTGEAWWTRMNERFAQCCIALGADGQSALRAAELVRPMLCRGDNYALYPDTRAALEAVLAAGGRNVLVSNNYPELPDVVAQLGLDGMFCGYAVSGAIGYEKPRREIFDAAREIGGDGVYTMVGDNIVADVEGAKRAGMRTVYVHRGYDARADWCFDGLIEVADIL